MRGNPILRAVLLVVALGLTATLVATVLGNARRATATTLPTPAPVSVSARSSLVPTLLTITLSSPAKSLSFTEPSGRIIDIPTGDGLELEHPAELTVSNNSWSALLAVAWEDPARPNFLRIEFEPRQLKSSHLLLDFNRDTTEHSLSTTFDPGP